MGETKIPYTVKRSARRTIALCVKHDGTLEVRAPLWADISSIESFILSKRSWILKKTEFVKKPGIARQSISDGGTVFLLGKEYKIVCSARCKRVNISGSEILCPQGDASSVKKNIMAR